MVHRRCLRCDQPVLSVPYCSQCWPGNRQTFSQEMPWDPNGSHHDVVPDAIPIPHSRRHEVIAALHNSGTSGDRQQDSAERNLHKPAPATRDAGTMTEPQQRRSSYNKPASPHLDSHHSEQQGRKVTLGHNTEKPARK
ncbi:uncharacterized protein LOC142585468 [Dermacentor variabilis]|uniref:uncharacterized protein LOC142585468 n=1 Tax=Dermacentor variabilis TaxID=34621 RepID=UPI003F5C0D4F